MKFLSFPPYPLALNYWYERREVILALIQTSLPEGNWGKVRRRPGAFKVQVVFFLTPALKKAFSPRDKPADLPVEKSLSEIISPCKHGPILGWPALAPAFLAACTGHCCVSILQRAHVTSSLHLQVLFVQSARCQGWEISHGSCVSHVIGLLHYSPARPQYCSQLLGKLLAGDQRWWVKCFGSLFRNTVVLSLLHGRPQVSIWKTSLGNGQEKPWALKAPHTPCRI